MQIKFDGTLDEFHALFSGMALYVGDGEEEEEEGAGEVRSFPVHKGGRRAREEAVIEEEEEEVVEEDMSVSVNPLANDMPVPENKLGAGTLPKLSKANRAASWAKFKELCDLWVVNFGKTVEVEVERPVALRNDAGVLVDAEGVPVKAGKQATYEQVMVTEAQPAPQPDRVEALANIGSGRHPIPILIMAYEIGSLQRLVEKALLDGAAEPPAEFTSYASWLEHVDQIAMNMVQVSHKAFPDLAGTYDHSTRWSRTGDKQ